jgi:D-alanyl-D-alanine carboxypeptidase
MENPTVIRRRNQLARGLRWDVDVVKSQYVRPAGQNMIMV